MATQALDVFCPRHGARAGEWCHLYRRICRTRIHAAGMETRKKNRLALLVRRDRLIAEAKSFAASKERG